MPRACIVVLLLCGLAVRPPSAVAGPAEADPAVRRGLGALEELRRRVDPAAGPPAEETWVAVSPGGRPALVVKGRVSGPDGRPTLRDEAIVDLGAGRVTSFVWFPNASARKAGEAIISLGEVSSRADAQVRRLLPGTELALEGIQRYRASGEESIYYEASFTDPGGDVPFLQPTVRLLLDASTGNFFRFDADPDWFAPPKAPKARLSRKAAERVAAAALAARDLSPALGAGAAPGKTGAAELFIVRPNDWLASPGEAAAARARVAWVVPFSLKGEPGRLVHRLFVDAATGKLLGGLPGAR